MGLAASANSARSTTSLAWSLPNVPPRASGWVDARRSALRHRLWSPANASVGPCRLPQPPSHPRLPHGPAATDRKHLADEAGGRVAAEVGGEQRVFFGRHQPAQRHLALQALLEARVGLHRRAVVGGGVDEVLRDR